MALGTLAGLIGCDGEDAERVTPGGDSLTIYSSAPSQLAHGRAFVAGARFALAEHDGRLGPFRIDYVPLDSAPERESSTPEAVADNAERAAEDPAAIAYIGELDSATAAVSLPILNDAGLAQVGPASLPAGLTRAGVVPGAGDPDRHYPTGVRHFVRTVPSEDLEAAGIAEMMRAHGCGSAFALAGAGGESARLLRQLAVAGEAAGVPVVGQAELPSDAGDAAELAEDLAEARAPCAALAEISSRELGTRRAMLPRALYEMSLFGDERVADPVSESAPAPAAHAVSGASIPPSALPAAFSRFASRYRARYGRLPGPWALYGYEAMKLVVDAIRRAGERADERAAVIEALFATRDRRGAVGRYSIDRNGDTTLRKLGVWRTGTRPPAFERAIAVSPPRGPGR